MGGNKRRSHDEIRQAVGDAAGLNGGKEFGGRELELDDINTEAILKTLESNESTKG